MLSVIVMSATAILLAGFILWSQRRDAMRLLTPRKESLLMKVQIICGDCAGVDPLPKKTYLTRSGECDQCGGHSFVLASTIAVRATRLRTVQERPARRGMPAKIAV
ncbi:MAG: hypothetical protein AB1631_15435 [Acidobacteriota bacterium]